MGPAPDFSILPIQTTFESACCHVPKAPHAAPPCLSSIGILVDLLQDLCQEGHPGVWPLLDQEYLTNLYCKLRLNPKPRASPEQTHKSKRRLNSTIVSMLVREWARPINPSLPIPTVTSSLQGFNYEQALCMCVYMHIYIHTTVPGTLRQGFAGNDAGGMRTPKQTPTSVLSFVGAVEELSCRQA